MQPNKNDTDHQDDCGRSCSSLVTTLSRSLFCACSCAFHSFFKLNLALLLLLLRWLRLRLLLHILASRAQCCCCCCCCCCCRRSRRRFCCCCGGNFCYRTRCQAQTPLSALSSQACKYSAKRICICTRTAVQLSPQCFLSTRPSRFARIIVPCDKIKKNRNIFK